MTMTTYRHEAPSKHEDKELQKLLDEMSEKTGQKWFVETVVCHVTKRWFGPDKIHTYTNMLMELPGGFEYQEFLCVGSIGEAKAYLIGALGAYEKSKQKIKDRFQSIIDGEGLTIPRVAIKAAVEDII